MVPQSYKSLLTLLVIGALLAALCPACVAPEVTVRNASHPCCPADKDPVPAKSEQCPRARFAMDWNDDAGAKIARPTASGDLVADLPAPLLRPMLARTPLTLASTPAAASESLFLLHSILRI